MALTTNPNERLAASLQIFLNLLTSESIEVQHIDRNLIDSMIARLDDLLSDQLDEILHHPLWQQCESGWRSLKYLIDRTDFRANIKVELLDVDKEILRDDFEDATDITQTGLYKHIYTEEYDTPGGEPVSAIISDYEFDSSHADIKLLSDLSKVAAAAHCPFFGSVGAKFFKKQNMGEVANLNDLANHMEKIDFMQWNSLRKEEDSRYLGLTLPKFLLRLPYGEQNRAKSCYMKREYAILSSNIYGVMLVLCWQLTLRDLLQSMVGC